MDRKDISYYQFAVAVAASCADKKEETSNDLQSSIRMIEDAVKLILHGTGIQTRVIPIPYPAASKYPLLISFSNGCKRLLWYYPQMDVPTLAQELEGLMCDVVEQWSYVSA